LGLFDLKNFLGSQKCSWVKRAMLGSEWWKLKLRELTELVTESLTEKTDTYPILGGIAESFHIFKHMFYKYNENFLVAPIVNNNIFTLRRNAMIPVTPAYFGALWPEYDIQIRNITMENIGTRDGYVSLENFREITGVPIDQRQLGGIRGAFDIAIERLTKGEDWQKNSKKMSEFLSGIRRGSKKFRKILCCENQEQIPHNMVKFSNNVEIIIGLSWSRILNSSWNVSYFSNSFRTFIFKLHNNTLSYNYMVARFVNNIDPGCSFCILGRIPEMERETPMHLFYTCPFVEQIANRFYRFLMQSNDDLRRTELFGLLTGQNIDENTSKFFFTAMKLYKFYI